MPQSATSPKATGPQQRVPVLLLVHPSGAVELFGDRQQVDVQLIHLPNIGEDSARADLAAERFVESRLSLRHKGVFWPGWRLSQGHVRACTRPSDRQRAAEVVEAIRWADELDKQLETLNGLTDGREVPCA